MSIDPLQPWSREFAYRIRRHFFLKVVGTTAWVWVFFVGYFHLLRHAAYPAMIMPLTALDGLVPVMPIALVPYLSLWFYVGIAPGLQRTFRELLAYGFWSALLCLAGLAIFYRFPTRIPAFVFDRGGMPGFDLLQGIDAPGNACPSMHVGIAMFTAIWIDVLFREMRVPAWPRVVNALWFAAITFSTLAIRQHVVVDAAAGALLGVAFAVPSLIWRPRRRERNDARDGGRSARAMIAESSSTTGPIAATDGGRVT